MSDEERIAYWKDCYDRMAARNTEIAGLANDLMQALQHLTTEAQKQETALRLGGSLEPFDLQGAIVAAKAAIAKAWGKS